ncbi:MAG: MMPL family transporter, partial [Candidatus Thermoplasmatota archaeon]
MRDLVARMQDAYGTVPGFNVQVYVTGSAPLSIDEEFLLGSGAEFIATLILVVVLIGLYFRSVLSPAFPILTIGIAILVSNLFVYFIAVYVFSLHFTATAVLQTVLLAAGTDYSIFLIARYRDERQDGKDKKEAVHNSVVWAGESVATSGGAVLISFIALSLGSFPIVKGMGVTIGFAVTVALALALTFIPAIMMVLGDRVFWPSGHRVARVRKKGERTASERYFQGAADFSMRHAKAVVLVALLVTVPAVYLVVTDTPSFDLSEGVPPTESSRGLDAISDSFGHGFVFPTVVVVRFPDPVVSDGTVSVPEFDAIDALRARLLADEPAVKSVEGPTNPQGSPVDYRNMSTMPPVQREAILAAMSPYIGGDNRTVRVQAVLVDPPFSREAIAAIDRVDALIDRIRADEPE